MIPLVYQEYARERSRVKVQRHQSPPAKKGKTTRDWNRVGLAGCRTMGGRGFCEGDVMFESRGQRGMGEVKPGRSVGVRQKRG